MTNFTPSQSLEPKPVSVVTWGWRLSCLAAAIYIAWQSLEPGTGIMGYPYTDKILHFIAYLTLSGLALLSRFSSRTVRVLTVIFAFSVLMEVMQGLMNMGRTASVADVAANLAGILVAWGLWNGAKALRN